MYLSFHEAECSNNNPSKFIKIISSDDHEFIIKKEVALTSGTIKVLRYFQTNRFLHSYVQAMLSGPGVFHEQETNEIHFQEIPSHVLSKGLFLCLPRPY